MLTEKFATALFENEDPMGKIVRIGSLSSDCNYYSSYQAIKAAIANPVKSLGVNNGNGRI